MGIQAQGDFKINLSSGFFAGFDLKKLQMQYPDRVKINGDAVTLVGPVAVDKTSASRKASSAFFYSAIVAIISFVISNEIFIAKKQSHIRFRIYRTEQYVTLRKERISAVIALALGCVVFYFLNGSRPPLSVTFH